jgi:hypothetical protein
MKLCWAFVTALILLATSPTHADLLIDKIEVNNRHYDQEADIAITFNQAPDFVTVDSRGRATHALQLYFAPRSVPNEPWNISVLGRVNEGDTLGSIRFRNGPASIDYDGPDLDFSSGGWGSIRGEVPYLLDDRTLSFTATYDLIGTPDAWWSLKAETFEFGALRGRVGVVAPEPSSLLLLLLGSSLLLTRHAMRRT